MDNIRFGVHHGVIVFSLLHIMKTLPDIVEGLKYVDRLEERD
jgi:hypothetical protein